MSAEARLRHYASVFDVVEVNSSYYAIPDIRNTQRWVERTPPGFVFHVKAYSLMTGHHPRAETVPADLTALLPRAPGRTRRGEIDATSFSPEALDRAFALFRAAVGPIAEAGKLGYVLFQFAPWVHFDADRLEYLASLPARLPGFTIAIEFRHRSWLPDHVDDTLRALSDARLAHVIVDAPSGGAALPRVTTVTAPTAVFRLHGRNAEGWLRQLRGEEPHRAPARRPRHGVRRRPSGLRRFRETAHELSPRILRERAAWIHGRARARAGFARRPFTRRRRLDHARIDASVAGRAAGARRRHRPRVLLPSVVDLPARRAARSRRDPVARRERAALQSRARALFPRARPARGRLLHRLQLRDPHRRRGARGLSGDAARRAGRFRDPCRGLSARADDSPVAGAADPRPPGPRGVRRALRGSRRSAPARGGSLGRCVRALPADRTRRGGERLARRFSGRPSGAPLAEQPRWTRFRRRTSKRVWPEATGPSCSTSARTGRRASVGSRTPCTSRSRRSSSGSMS